MTAITTNRLSVFVSVCLVFAASFAAVGADAPAEVKVSDFSFKPPAGWETVTTRSPMRKAQYKVTKEKESAEVVFFHFGPGGAGGVQANVDRWFGQFQEPKEKLNAKTEEVKAGKNKATLVQAQGTYLNGPPGGQKVAEPNSMMYAAILEGGEGGPVFVKMTGPKAVVESAQPAFRKMVEEALK